MNSLIYHTWSNILLQMTQPKNNMQNHVRHRYTESPMINPINFTEQQVQIVSQIQKQSFKNGIVWGVIYSISTAAGITAAVCLATRFGHLFF